MNRVARICVGGVLRADFIAPAVRRDDLVNRCGCRVDADGALPCGTKGCVAMSIPRTDTLLPPYAITFSERLLASPGTYRTSVADAQALADLCAAYLEAQ